MTAVQCKFNKYGFCKFREECRNSHSKEICGILHCNEQDCDRRHPRTCRFFALYQSCKFGDDCAYLHKATESSAAVELENRIAATEEGIRVLENLIKQMEEERKRTAAEEERKRTAAEERIGTLENIIEQMELNDSLESDDEDTLCSVDEAVDGGNKGENIEQL